MEPPIRLIAGRQLALLFGQQHPATDAEIARRAHRQRTPFSRGRIRALALAPAKQGRYLLVAFLLALLYPSPGLPRCSICFCVRFCRLCSR